jgi:hypothetical protein
VEEEQEEEDDDDDVEELPPPAAVRFMSVWKAVNGKETLPGIGSVVLTEELDRGGGSSGDTNS